MKRIGGLEDVLRSRENIELAVKEARSHRSKRNALTRSMAAFMADYENSVAEVARILSTGDWDIRGYRTFTINEHGKSRLVDWNPSFRDNVIQHALYRTVGVRLNATLIRDTFAGIPGRGTHHGMERVFGRIRTKYRTSPLYIMKADIRHFYENIDIGLLKRMLSAKIKDPVVVRLLHALLDSHPHGLPIGNFLSQLLANFYLGEVDRWAVSQGVDWFRYCDDVVALSDSKEKLNAFMLSLDSRLRLYGLELKRTMQVFPVERTNGLDFMGFTMNRMRVRLRKRIERGLRKAVLAWCRFRTESSRMSAASYMGWTCWLTRGELLAGALLAA